MKVKITITEVLDVPTGTVGHEVEITGRAEELDSNLRRLSPDKVIVINPEVEFLYVYKDDIALIRRQPRGVISSLAARFRRRK